MALENPLRKSFFSSRQFLSTPAGNAKWIESAFDIESAFYWSAMSMAIRSPSVWKRDRIAMLNRLLVTAHAHKVAIPAAADKMPGRSSLLLSFSFRFS